VPAKPITLLWINFRYAAEQAGLSRQYGGVHFKHGDKDARAAGASAGKNAWAKALTYFNGTAVVPTTEPATTVAPTTPPRHQRAPLVESRPASVPGRRFHVTQAVVSVSRSRYRAGSGHPGPGRGVRRIGRLTSSTASSRSARGHDAVPLGSRHGRGSAGYRPSSSADCAKSVSGALVLYASTRDEPVHLSDSRPETHQHSSPADANCCHSLLLDPDAMIRIDLHKRLFLLVNGREE
jgi:hypothetical protein